MDLEALIDLAHEDFDAGRYGDAKRTLDVLLTRGGPCVAQASLLRARLAIRCGEPQLAVRIIGDARSTFGEMETIEASLHLMLAHAFTGDAATAALYAESLSGIGGEVPDTLRAEISHARAGAAWSCGAVDAAESELERCEEHADSRSRARHLSLVAAIAGRREQYAQQADLVALALAAIDEDPAPEIPLAANLLRSLCIVARELLLPEPTVAKIVERYRRLPWTDELAPDRFICALQLAWVKSLGGDALGAVRFAHEAYAKAPTAAWSVMALADRASLKRACGEHSSALIDLEDALALADSIDWNETPDEERLALVTLAELAAAVDGPRAHALLLRSEMLRPGGSRRMAYHDNRRLRAIAQHAAAVVAEAVGDIRLARASYKAAHATFADLGLSARAAESALRLYHLTGEEAWLRLAVDHARAYPLSTVAQDARAANTGVGDQAYAALTPRQREVFRALLDGLTATRIAERVGAKPNTVRNHIHGVYAAFGVKSQAELLAEARKRKLA